MSLAILSIIVSIGKKYCFWTSISLYKSSFMLVASTEVSWIKFWKSHLNWFVLIYSFVSYAKISEHNYAFVKQDMKFKTRVWETSNSSTKNPNSVASGWNQPTFVLLYRFIWVYVEYDNKYILKSWFFTKMHAVQ